MCLHSSNETPLKRDNDNIWRRYRKRKEERKGDIHRHRHTPKRVSIFQESVNVPHNAIEALAVIRLLAFRRKLKFSAAKSSCKHCSIDHIPIRVKMKHICVGKKTANVAYSKEVHHATYGCPFFWTCYVQLLLSSCLIISEEAQKPIKL